MCSAVDAFADLWGRRPTEALSLVIGVGGGFAFYLVDGGWLMAAGIFVSNLGAFAFGPVRSTPPSCFPRKCGRPRWPGS